MSNRLLTLAVITLMTGCLSANVGAQQRPQYSGSTGAWEHFASQQNQLDSPLNAASVPQAPQQQVPQQQVLQYDAPVYDPIQMLETRVDSLQYKLDSLSALQCSDQCNPCNNEAGGLNFGAAVVFAKPHFKEAFQYSQTNLLTGQQTLIPFNYDYQATPRVWLGYQRSDSFGFRVTFWNFDEDGQTSSNTADGFNIYGAHAVSIIFPANIFASMPGETLTNADSLKTQIYNYDVTYDAHVAGFDILGKLGLRYASLEQTLDSVVFDPTGTPIAQLNWKRAYDGLGPSVSVDAKKRLGLSPVSVVAQGGGAFLFGTKTLNRTVLGDQSPQPAAPFLSLEDADEVVGIGELGLGVEWCHWLANGHHLLIRGQYEGQLWAEAVRERWAFSDLKALVSKSNWHGRIKHVLLLRPFQGRNFRKHRIPGCAARPGANC